MLSFLNKNIVLCVTGGIAAYKSAEIIRLFKKEGADVRVVMTESAKERSLILKTLASLPNLKSTVRPPLLHSALSVQQVSLLFILTF